jgi:hypothetical protein
MPDLTPAARIALLVLIAMIAFLIAAYLKGIDGR